MISIKAAIFCLFFNLFNAELSPKRYWQGPRSHNVGEEGDLHLTLHCHHHNDSAVTRTTVKAILNVNAKFDCHKGSVVNDTF